METYLWLFPIIFIFHNLEEIIGMKIWLDKNQVFLQKRFPKVAKMFQDFSTEGLALATLEEFILCVLLCGAVAISHHFIFWGIWLGAFIGCALHFLGHILQFFILKKYIPAVATSVICLPISIFIIVKVYTTLVFDIWEVFSYLFLGFLLVFINLFFAQKLIGVFTRRMNKL